MTKQRPTEQPEAMMVAVPGIPIEGIRPRALRTHSDAPAPDTAPDTIGHPGPHNAAVDDAVVPEGAESPYYDREWRGSALYQCPEGDFPGRSHAAVERHIGIAHPGVTGYDMAVRAAMAGIILAR